MFKNRVVVTGLGMLSPIGNTVHTNWNALISGYSGIDVIKHFDVQKYLCKIAGLVKNFYCDDVLFLKERRKMDIFIQYGVVASAQAIKDSAILITEENAYRIGIAIGSGIGGLELIEHNYNILMNQGPRKINPFFVPSTIINMISGYLSIKYGIKGPSISITTACATGLHNIGYAARMIAYNDVDIMIAGGSEKASTPLGIGGFSAARALSKRNHEPKQASRPWDKERDGFVLGDGAGILVLEKYNHAKKRGARIYAEIVGFGMSSDAYHVTSPPSNGEGAAMAMKNALKDAQINPDQIDYINAHATSTIVGDKAELRAIKSVFGKTNKKLMISSTKSMIGHLLGAAGAVESIYSILALYHQCIPPTINLDNPDEHYNFDLVPHTARQVKNFQYALCNSFGFGGTNASLIFRKI